MLHLEGTFGTSPTQHLNLCLGHRQLFVWKCPRLGHRAPLLREKIPGPQVEHDYLPELGKTLLLSLIVLYANFKGLCKFIPLGFPGIKWLFFFLFVLSLIILKFTVLKRFFILTQIYLAVKMTDTVDLIQIIFNLFVRLFVFQRTIMKVKKNHRTIRENMY